MKNRFGQRSKHDHLLVVVVVGWCLLVGRCWFASFWFAPFVPCFPASWLQNCWFSVWYVRWWKNSPFQGIIATNQGWLLALVTLVILFSCFNARFLRFFLGMILFSVPRPWQLAIFGWSYPLPGGLVQVMMDWGSQRSWRRWSIFVEAWLWNIRVFNRRSKRRCLDIEGCLEIHPKKTTSRNVGFPKPFFLLFQIMGCQEKRWQQNQVAQSKHTKFAGISCEHLGKNLYFSINAL